MHIFCFFEAYTAIDDNIQSQHRIYIIEKHPENKPKQNKHKANRKSLIH